jgi:16S rRNA (cytidine1402-2'-O)-methyltransferase
MSRLYLVPNALDLGSDATPIDDVLPRGVLRVAAGLGHWLAENAKTARAFLKRVDAVTPLAAPLQTLSIVELPRPPKGRGGGIMSVDAGTLLAPLRAGHDLGLLSEAGLPAVADPGATLVARAHADGIEVVPLPGPSAITLAIAASGLEGQRFAFVGYLPTDAAARAARIRELEARSRRLDETQVAIETPYRNAALLGGLLEHLHPGTRLSVSAGLTLAGARTRSAAVSEWRSRPGGVALDLPAVFAFLAR